VARSATFLVAIAIAVGGAACGNANHPPIEHGSVQLMLTTVPSDVQCLVLTASTSSTVAQRSFALTQGQPATLSANGLPTGTVTLSEATFNVPCGSVTSNTTPTWISSAPVTVQLLPGQPTSVSITLVRPGQITIINTFDDPSVDGGVPGDGGIGTDTPVVVDGAIKLDTPVGIDTPGSDTPVVVDGSVKLDTPVVVDGAVKLDTPVVVDGSGKLDTPVGIDGAGKLDTPVGPG
jgi:hypothetical protein